MSTRRLAAGLVAATLTISLAACSSDTEGTTDGAADAPDSAAASDGNFPVTIEHAFGETVIEEAPERVATVAWNNHEVPLALGVTPVGMEKVTWGDDDNNGMLPWVEEKLSELGSETPELFDATDALPFETIANTQPDVILASYSGLTQEDYDQLSQIAPVVAYPEQAWGTSLEEMIEMNSTAIGKPEEGQELIDSIHADIQTAMDDHPELQGTKPAFAFIDNSDTSKIGIYTPADPRVSFLVNAGFEQPQVVTDNDSPDSFYTEVSAENPEAFEDVDFLITYGSDDAAENEASLKAWQEDPLLSRIPAISEGKVAFLGNGPVAATANASPLSVGWGVDQYFSILEEAAK